MNFYAIHVTYAQQFIDLFECQNRLSLNKPERHSSALYCEEIWLKDSVLPKNAVLHISWTRVKLYFTHALKRLTVQITLCFLSFLLHDALEYRILIGQSAF